MIESTPTLRDNFVTMISIDKLTNRYILPPRFKGPVSLKTQPRLVRVETNTQQAKEPPADILQPFPTGLSDAHALL